MSQLLYRGCSIHIRNCTSDIIDYIMVHEGVTDLNSLWNHFQANICNDLLHCLQLFTGVLIDFEDSHYNYELFLFNALLTDFNKTPVSYQLPQYTLNWGRLQGNPLIQAELQYAPKYRAGVAGWEISAI